MVALAITGTMFANYRMEIIGLAFIVSALVALVLTAAIITVMVITLYDNRNGAIQHPSRE
jgi:hypothetical protein